MNPSIDAEWLTVAQGIATHLPDAAATIERDGQQVNGALILTGKLTLHLHRWHSYDKATASLWLPSALNEYRPYRQGKGVPSINVSLDRPAKDLAADIARRLIPDALEYQVQAQASYDRTKNDVDKARENFDVAITRPSGGQFPISQGDRDMDRT